MSGFTQFGSSGARFPLRYIIAIGLVLFAVGQFFFSAQKNPVTGEKQHVAMTPEQEVALGIQSAPQMARQMGGLVDPSDPRAQLVKELGQRLVTSADLGGSPYQFDFHLLADEQTVNAFALPGGQIFITLGLMDQLENEAQLAGVLGHEMGHVVNRHSAEHMATGRLGQMLATAAGVAATDDQGNGRGTQMAAMVVNQMLQLRYSRQDESESDKYGLEYMADAGFHPREMLGVMEVLERASQGNRQPEFLASHPNPGNRAERIREFLEKNYPDGKGSELTSGRPLK